MADKHSKQKFFPINSIKNPTFGTLVNEKVVTEKYDFYMISQQCNRGTVKPIHYRVLYNDSNTEEGVLQELLYIQSFNYMNWTGSIRVPSVLQYAEKLAKFAGDSIHEELESNQFNDHLYFL